MAIAHAHSGLQIGNISRQDLGKLLVPHYKRMQLSLIKLTLSVHAHRGLSLGVALPNVILEEGRCNVGLRGSVWYTSCKDCYSGS